MRKKLLVVLLTTVMTAAILTGCGSKAEDAMAVTATAGTDAEEETETETETQENTQTAGNGGEISATGETKTTEPEETGGPETPESKTGEQESAETQESTKASGTGEETPATGETSMAANTATLEASPEHPVESEAKETESAPVAEEKEVAADPAPAQESGSYSTDWLIENGWLIIDTDLLPLVNEDRANNGVSELVWSDSLAQYCLDRIPVVNYNLENGLWSHEGYTKRENLTYGAVIDSEQANQNWIKSAGHHEARIESSYTSYAAVAYMNPDTGLIIWIEAFE